MLRKNFPGRKNRRREIAIKNLESAISLKDKMISKREDPDCKFKNKEEQIKELKTGKKNLQTALANTKRNLTV